MVVRESACGGAWTGRDGPGERHHDLFCQLVETRDSIF